jgi:hypothetical protein
MELGRSLPAGHSFPSWESICLSRTHGVFNSGRELIIWLNTPLKIRYEEAYTKVHPFDKIVEGRLQPKMIE